MHISLLDCTLRDGGYINDWKFLDKQINEIINSLENSNVEKLWRLSLTQYYSGKFNRFFIYATCLICENMNCSDRLSKK